MIDKLYGGCFLIAGILLVIFRRGFAKFVFWYHLKYRYRLKYKSHRKKFVPDLFEKHPKDAELAQHYAKRVTEIAAVIAGLIFAITGLLSLLGVFKFKS